MEIIQIGGKEKLSVRIKKLHDKWYAMRYEKHLTPKEIARRIRRPDGMQYHPRYISNITSKMRKLRVSENQ